MTPTESQLLRFAVHVAAGESPEEAATSVGLSAEQLARLLSMPEVQQAMRTLESIGQPGSRDVEFLRVG